MSVRVTLNAALVIVMMTSLLSLRGVAAAKTEAPSAPILAKPAVSASEQIASASLLVRSEFWRDSAGWWASDNTYLNSDLQQKIAAYQSIVEIELKGRELIETTHRFYPPGDSANYYSQGRVPKNQGIEFISIAIMRAVDSSLSESGVVKTVKLTPKIPGQAGEITTTPLSPTLAIQRNIEPSSGLETYQTLTSMPTMHRRYTAMFGIRTGLESDEYEAGDLRGLAIFVGRRINEAEVEATRERFRQTNSVGAVVAGDADGSIVVTLLER